ncbi:UNVERIFIED_CONTAM: Leishmanolysin-like peptidase [Sesamum radiatum]|uniref:Leishmanolysin-like peptidase n=1 Tax=Sesamum radiatum TaxID=300843 RepID=A0AAW2QEW6_SESRA
MELRIRRNRCAEVSLLPRFELNFAPICVKLLLATNKEFWLQGQVLEQDKENTISHSCIHDQIIEQRKRPGRKVYSVSAQGNLLELLILANLLVTHKGILQFLVIVGRLVQKSLISRARESNLRLRVELHSACGQDGGVQLPREYVEGHVNVAPRHLTAEAETLLSATLIHEVMHVLGFDPHAFAHFRDERKRRRIRVTEQAMDEKLGRMASLANFTGLELEDGGGRGTSGSHWEKRLLMNEIMTGSVDTRSVVSKMTLALLEDSGWYQANYSMADRLDWGRNQGTEFVTLPCNRWKGAYHCNSTQFSGCTYNREAEGYCPIVNYSGDLPQWARYFPQANKGGQSSLADYCTYFVAYSDGSCTDTNSARAPDRMLGEVRGSSSRCMASSLVAVDGTWKVCPEAGGPVKFPGFNGELICPAYHELCNVDPLPVSGQCPNSCFFNGDCIDGRCHCFLGFEGHDCRQCSCPNNCGGHGECLQDGVCNCENGCLRRAMQSPRWVCDNGVCEFRCSDYAGYTCQNSSTLIPSLSVCKDVLQTDMSGQHCAPSELSILQQLEEVVVMPNYHRLFPGGPRKFLNYIRGRDCDGAAKRLACWISIQKCDEDGDNRLRVCHSACQSYNAACGASLDCSDQTLFSNEDEGEGLCTGWGELSSWL